MRQNPDYILRTTVDTMVILPVGRAAVDFPGMLAVNETGQFLWELLERERTEEELVRALCARYAVEPEQARPDVAEFLRRLRLAGAVLEDAQEAGEDPPGPAQQ